MSYRIRGARKIFEELFDEYRRIIYEYNSKIKDTGFYLKPAHIVYKTVNGVRRKYYYFGRYWWQIWIKGRRGTTTLVKWTYYGSRMPYLEKLLQNPPPVTPFDGISYAVEGDDVIITRENYEKLKPLLEKRGIKLKPEPDIYRPRHLKQGEK